VFAWVDDLARYPVWMELVHRVESEAASGPDGPRAWAIELRGRVGPFARSKRLRMVRTQLDPPTSVRFERQEVDGRRHSAWVLEARIAPLEPDPGPRSRLEMALHYEGRWWSPVLERVLLEQIESARDRLLTLVSAPA
jgi:hypothetical protein